MVTAEKSWYIEWFDSPYYHKLYFERDDKDAEIFIRKLISHLQPPQNASVLDAACGKGRHSRIMAGMGYMVTGIDISFESIDHAKQFESENLEFFQHDMRLPFRTNYYDYAFNFFTSFGYFRTQREHDDTLRTISNSLVASGIFVIDYLNVHYAEQHLVHNEDKIIDSTTYEIHRWHDEKHFFKKIRIKDDKLASPIEFTERVTKFSVGDFNDMLAYQGMQVLEIFGDHELNPYHVTKTPRMIIVAKKKSNGTVEDTEKRLYSDGRSSDALT